MYNIKDNGLPASQCATGLLKITVSPTATAADITTKDTTICYGTTATLTVSASGISNPFYKWYVSQTASNSFNIGASYNTLSLTADTIFYISVSGTDYCENAAGDRTPVKITVYPELNGGTIGIGTGTGTSQAYCYGITPFISLGILPASGGSNPSNYTYQWESSIDTGKTWTNTGTITQDYSLNSPLPQTTQYRRAVTDNLGCGTKYSDTITITILPLPVVSVGTTDLCIGLTTQLFPSTEGTWVSNNDMVAEIINNREVKGLLKGTATLTYTNIATGCFAVIPITVEDFPVVADITGENVLCPNNTIQLSNSTPGGVWTSNNNNVTLDNATANPVTVTGVTEGSTYITYTVSNGACQTKHTHPLKIIPADSPSVIIGFPK
jgi:hypothetical protein